MPRRSTLSAAEREQLLALPETSANHSESVLKEWALPYPLTLWTGYA
ncbi:hypothetical protein [Hymenobacter sp. YC55]|nr:hypothetical protein [Hymenobacter sp. YC55]MDF7815096.1 hypothetical protein [Hymenobacter sp. YC55]